MAQNSNANGRAEPTTSPVLSGSQVVCSLVDVVL